MDPGGNIGHSWTGNQWLNPLFELDFEYEVLKPGFYQARIINTSSHDLLVYVKIEPGGWSYYQTGKVLGSWEIVK